MWSMPGEPGKEHAASPELCETQSPHFTSSRKGGSFQRTSPPCSWQPTEGGSTDCHPHSPGLARGSPLPPVTPPEGQCWAQA